MCVSLGPVKVMYFALYSPLLSLFTSFITILPLAHFRGLLFAIGVLMSHNSLILESNHLVLLLMFTLWVTASSSE
jgi:hypothetical protein